MAYGINLFAVIVCIISSWILGGLWYSKTLFGRFYCDNADKSAPKKMEHPGMVFGAAFALWTISAFGFAFLVGADPAFAYAVYMGLVVGFCFVSTSLGVNYAFANRGIKFYLIDSGYHIFQFMIYGAILGVWH